VEKRHNEEYCKTVFKYSVHEVICNELRLYKLLCMKLQYGKMSVNDQTKSRP